MRSITSRVREAMHRNSPGITLIELIVTIAIFGAVTTVLLGSFITIFSVREQTTVSQEANDDIRVILDGIEREIQAGNDINANGNTISFVVSSRGDVPPYPVKYRLYDSAIQKAVGNNAVSGDPCNFNTNSMAFADDEDCFLPITGDNVEISVLDFSVQAPEVEQAQTSPLVTLSLVGEVLDSAGKASPLTYSTSITPRNRVTVSDVEQTLGIGDPIVTLENILPPAGWGCQVSRVPYNPTDPPALPPEGFGSTFYTDCLGVNIDFSVDTGNSGLHSLRYTNTTSGSGAVYQGTGEVGGNIPVVFDTDANRLTLVAGSENLITVRTENLFGNRATGTFAVRQVVFTDPSPGPVANLTATTGACGSGEITLAWDTPTVVVGTAGPATEYEVTGGGSILYYGPATTYTDVGVVTPNVDYYVRAYNLGGFGPSTTVTGTAPSACVGAPTVNLQASETTLTVGQPAYLTWTSTDADSCTASAVPAVPGWSGGKSVNGGPQSTGALALGTYTFTLTCERAGNSNSDSVTVDVEYGVGCLTGTYYERTYKDQTSGTCPSVWGYPGLEPGCVNPVGGNLTASCDPVTNAGDYCVTRIADSCSPGNTFNRGKITCCLPGPVEPPCPFVADANTTIVNFNLAGAKILSNYGPRASTSHSVAIPAGTYTVQLAAWDGYLTRPASVTGQDQEQYYVELMDGTVSRAVTGSTADLADGIEATDIRTVSTGLVVPAGVDTLWTRHSAYLSASSSPNSVGPICAAFTREAAPPPPPANKAPSADAGVDMNFPGALGNIPLNGSGSGDSDGSIVSYSWENVGNTWVNINNPTTVNPTVQWLNTDRIYTFRLTVTDNGGLTDTDDVKVFVGNTGNIAPPACPFAPNTSTKVIDFSGVRIRSDGDAVQAVTNRRSLALTPGTYRIRTASWDGAVGRALVPAQPNESWRLVFIEDGTPSTIIATTGATTDVPDFVESSLVNEILDNSFTLPSAVTGVYARHAVYPDGSFANSVEPVCFSIERL